MNQHKGGKLFPNFSSSTEEDSDRQKVGNKIVDVVLNLFWLAEEPTLLTALLASAAHKQGKTGRGASLRGRCASLRFAALD